jgi:hypothetical protein
MQISNNIIDDIFLLSLYHLSYTQIQKAENKSGADDFKSGLAAWRDHLSFIHYCKANNLHDPRYDINDNDSGSSKHHHSKSLVKQARKTILNPLNLLSLNDEKDKKKERRKKNNKSRSDGAAAAAAGGGLASVDRGSLSKSQQSRPAVPKRAPSKTSISMESAVESADYSDDTIDYDFDDDEDPDSGTDEEESVRGSFRRG